MIDDQAIDWEALTPMGHTADEIATAAEEKNADLVISATHGRSGLKRFVLGSVTERLMRTLPCPLFVVRGLDRDYAADVNEDLGFHRIL